MEWLKRLWNGLKEPVEEAAKLAYHLATDKYVEDPKANLLPRLPDAVRPTVEAFLASPGGAEAIVAILTTMQDAGEEALEKINPEG